MPHTAFNQELCSFLLQSPTAFHATSNGAKILKQAGYQRLYETDSWANLAPGRYYVCRNDSSLIGFQLVDQDQPLRMAGAHTDSPCLRVKPNPLHTTSDYLQLGVEVYGGALLNPWFDRDLSMAGRVLWHNGDQQIRSSLLDFRTPLAIIPSLAIHLDREANTSRTINKQTDLVPLVMLTDAKQQHDFADLLKKQLTQEYPHVGEAEIVDYDLFLYDCQPPALVGLNKEFITSARLDNLLSCFCILQAAVQSNTDNNFLFVLNDHEEVGSVSTSGAQGPFLRSILQRLYSNTNVMDQILSRSWLISVDNAHAVHPNFVAKHEPQHMVKLNGGPVIKINANQRYASNGCTSSLFKLLCTRNNIPFQEFVMRNDMACGSTIGPLTSAAIGIPTLDIGAPQLAMHSIRETVGNMDGYNLGLILTAFFNEQQHNLICSGVE